MALRRQQAQEESEARELGLQLQYNNGACPTGPVMGTSSAPTRDNSPPHPHVPSPAGLAIAAAQIQNQLHQQSDCGLLRMRVPQDGYPSPDKNEGSLSGKFNILL